MPPRLRFAGFSAPPDNPTKYTEGDGSYCWKLGTWGDRLSYTPGMVHHPFLPVTTYLHPCQIHHTMTSLCHVFHRRNAPWQELSSTLNAPESLCGRGVSIFYVAIPLSLHPKFSPSLLCGFRAGERALLRERTSGKPQPKSRPGFWRGWSTHRDGRYDMNYYLYVSVCYHAFFP